MFTRNPSIIFLVGWALLAGGFFLGDTGRIGPDFLWATGIGLIISGFVLFIICFVAWTYRWFFLPVKRREQARFFLELLSLAEESGHSIEQTIIEFSKSGERPLGEQFDRVARHIESGLNLPEALAKVPGYLPAQVVATLKVGHETGGMNMTLPVAQENLREKNQNARGEWGYLVAVMSIAVMIVGILMTYVIPKFKMIYADMLEPGKVMPEFTLVVLKISDTIKNNAAALFILLFLLLGVWFYCKKKGWLDTFWLLIPWRRKRLQRDYSRVLALLLDSGLPEEKAIELAAQSTSNRTIKKRARKVIAGLQSGLGLTEAIKLMDDSREFQWRLTNALQTEGNFVDALSGWHQSLSARADRQHQTFSTLMETTAVLLLGMVVGSIMVGMFLPLIRLMEKLIAW